MTTIIKSIEEKFTCKSSGNKGAQFGFFEVVALMSISILFGVVIGAILAYGKGVFNTHDVTTFEKELLSSYNRILDEYYGNVSEDDLMNAAIGGMIGVLDDPYSSYLDSKQTVEFNEKVDGNYVGIGVTLAIGDNGIYVYEVLKNSPAEKAGIMVNDVFVKIDDNDVSSLDISKLGEYTKGKSGTKVKITVNRNDEEIDLDVIRSVVEVDSVKSRIIEKENTKIGYIFIDIFASNVYGQFNSSIKFLENEGIDSLIIDVRDNPGGHLSQAKKILSLFFDKKTVLYQLQTKDKVEKVYSTSNKKRNYDIVILINSSSASAAEILASSFQDNYKGVTLVGTKSYGKGTVQQEIILSTGSSMKYTIEKWLTAKGHTIEGRGVIPDEEVEQSLLYYITPTDENDAQLQRAIEILLKKES